MKKFLIVASILMAPIAAVAGSWPGMWDLYVVPAVADTPGVNGTYWRTDLHVTNPYDWRSVYVWVQFLRADHDNTLAEERTYRVPAGGHLMLEDVLDREFGTSGAGALLVGTDDGSAIVVTSRTWTWGDTGSFGQTEAGQPFMNVVGDVATIAGVRNGFGFRSNVGVVNLSSRSVRFDLEAFDEDGQSRGSRTLDLLPWSQRQTSVASFAGSFEAGYVRVRPLSDDASIGWISWGSAVDDDSGDAVFLEDRIDDLGTRFVNERNLSGWWVGNLTWSGGSAAVEAWIDQIGALVTLWLYDYDSGCLEAKVSGYEHLSHVVLSGWGENSFCLGDELLFDLQARTGRLSGDWDGDGDCWGTRGDLFLEPYDVADSSRARPRSAPPEVRDGSPTARRLEVPRQRH